MKADPQKRSLTTYAISVKRWICISVCTGPTVPTFLENRRTRRPVYGFRRLRKMRKPTSQDTTDLPSCSKQPQVRAERNTFCPPSMLLYPLRTSYAEESVLKSFVY